MTFSLFLSRLILSHSNFHLSIMPRSRSPTPLSPWPLPVYTQRASNGSSSSHSSLASTSGRSSTSPFASQRSSATTLGSPSLDEIAPSYPLVDAAQSSDGKTRHLPHLLAFTAAVNLTKPSVSVVLAEPLVYIRPPGAGLAGLEEDPEQAEGGRNVSDHLHTLGTAPVGRRTEPMS